MDPTSFRVGRLRARLLLVLGASPLALSALQGCDCGRAHNDTVEFDDLVRMHDLVLLGVEQLDAECWDSGMGGMGGISGLAPVCDAVLPTDAVSPEYWDEYTIDEALSWTAESECPTPAQYEAMLALLQYGWASIDGSLPSPQGTCAYVRTNPCGEGRPFLVARQARVAPLNGREPSKRSLDALEQHLISAWCGDAQMEHASIAAFARLSLHLLALAAPLELVRAAQVASLDEAEHAALCLGEATRHGGGPFDWGPLDIDGAFADPSARELLITNIIEGCIGETLAAARARAQAEHAASPELARKLHTLADDEERHAALAWQILSWQLQTHDAELHQVALEVFQSQTPPPAAGDAPHENDARWQAAGRLCASEAAEVNRITWLEAVVPLATHLLSGSSKARVNAPAGPIAISAT